jgi:membrane associated rhomboid family serine protease
VIPGAVIAGAVIPGAVIPVGDHNPTRRQPWATWLLVAINLGVFVFIEPWAAGPCEQQRFFLRHAAVPAELTQGEPLAPPEIAATTPPACDLRPVPDKNVYLAALTSLFLHAGWVHLLGNLLYLWIFGNNVEDRFGHLRYLGFYLLAGVVATVAFVVPNGNNPATLVGASGAIAGVLGAYLVLYPRARVTVLVPFLFFLPLGLPAIVVLGLWFFLQLEGAQVAELAGSDVAYLAHVAGFVAGFVVGLLVRAGGGGRPRREQYAYYR